MYLGHILHAALKEICMETNCITLAIAEGSWTATPQDFQNTEVIYTIYWSNYLPSLRIQFQCLCCIGAVEVSI